MAKRSKRNLYTRIQLDFLRERYQDVTISALVKEYNQRFPHNQRTWSSIHAALKNHKITCGGQVPKTNWQCSLMTRTQCDWLEANYNHVSVKQITKLFNQRYRKELTPGQMKTFIKNRGFISGNSGWFLKGSEPPNKGTKGVMKANRTSFKPGPRHDRRFPIGHERIDKDGYVWVKSAQTNPHTGVYGHYIPKHKWLWERERGPIPANHVITFLDDNPTNCILDNLVLITRAELCRRNKLQYKQADPELRDTIKAIAKLQHTAGERARE